MEWSDKGDNTRALADYNTALQLDKTNADVYYNRGVLFHGEGDEDRAIADFTVAIALDPAADDYRMRGIAYRAKGDLKRAIAMTMRRFASLRTMSRASARAPSLNAAHEIDAAIADYTAIIHIDPTNADAYADRPAPF